MLTREEGAANTFFAKIGKHGGQKSQRPARERLFDFAMGRTFMPGIANAHWRSLAAKTGCGSPHSNHLQIDLDYFLRMSWELMSVEHLLCACGGGTIEITMEMDDWNRTRSGRVIHCVPCAESHAEVVRQREANAARRAALYNEAVQLAAERYLRRWLALFEGVSKKEGWRICTGGSGYPALGTFYTHVKDEGLEHYVTKFFKTELCAALKILKVSDDDVGNLLDRRNAIPEYREPHPWQ